MNLESFPPAPASIAAAPPFENKGRITLAWDRSPSPDVAGYRIAYGTNIALLNNSAGVGNVTNVTLRNLAEAQTYYFACASVGSNGVESALSNTVTNFIQPVMEIVVESWRARFFHRPGTNIWQVSTNLTFWTSVATQIVTTPGEVWLIRTNNGNKEFIRKKP